MNRSSLILLSVIFLGAAFRFYGINWDNTCCLHPDERAIIMYTLPLTMPHNIAEFFSPQSPLNAHFFAYGNLPLYLLKLLSVIAQYINPSFATYASINLIGRGISTLADLGTIIILYFIGKQVASKYVGYLASFFYAISVFPIQNSHFYTVDILLTFFITATLYVLLLFYRHPSKKNAVLIGVLMGLSLTTKISATTLFAAFTIALSLDFLIVFLKTPHRPHIWFLHLPVFIKRLLTEGVIVVGTTLGTFTIFQPYAIIDFHEFLEQNLQQSQMTHNAYIFPYTLQYVEKIPYLYELKNIFLWGLGPALATISFAGTVYVFATLIRSGKTGRNYQIFILFAFFTVYFLIVGNFAVGWMRYMLPVYPLFILFGAIFFNYLLQHLRRSSNIINISTLGIFFCSTLLWTLSFMHIYAVPHTRISATQWILQNIPTGSTLAIEHWDDRLPLIDSEKYRFVEMTLYDQPDDERKWQIINEKLQQADYIILASDRLYLPLQKLSDCTKYKLCYPQTALYYQKLFLGKLGFQKIAEFTSYPTIPILDIPLYDTSADEAFSVVDHPKVMIFKRR